MGYRILVSFLLGSCFYSALSQPAPPEDLPHATDTDSESHPPAPPPQDCKAVKCPAGTTCEMVSDPDNSMLFPECIPITFSPPPSAVSNKPTSTPIPATTSTATLPRRAESTTARAPSTARGPPAPPPPDCAGVKCPAGTKCELIVGPCDSVRCAKSLPVCVPESVNFSTASTTSAPPPRARTRFAKSRTTLSSTTSKPTTTTSTTTAAPSSRSQAVAKSAQLSKSAEKPLKLRHVSRTETTNTHSTSPLSSSNTQAPLRGTTPAASCAGKRCPSGSSCRIFGNRAVCITPGIRKPSFSDLCLNAKCPKGTVCRTELVKSKPMPLCVHETPSHLPARTVNKSTKHPVA